MNNLVNLRIGSQDIATFERVVECLYTPPSLDNYNHPRFLIFWLKRRWGSYVGFFGLRIS